MTGVGRSSVISQAVPILPSQMPMLDATLASHTALKVGIASGVQAEGLAGRTASGAVSPIRTPLSTPARTTRGQPVPMRLMPVLAHSAPAREFFPAVRLRDRTPGRYYCSRRQLEDGMAKFVIAPHMRLHE